MIKKRTISLYGYSKTNIFSKSFLIIGIILLCVFITLTLFTPYKSQAGIIIAFSILFLGVSAVLYFFYLQFTKLAQIAEELEYDDPENETQCDPINPPDERM